MAQLLRNLGTLLRHCPATNTTITRVCRITDKVVSRRDSTTHRITSVSNISTTAEVASLFLESWARPIMLLAMAVTIIQVTMLQVIVRLIILCIIILSSNSFIIKVNPKVSLKDTPLCISMPFSTAIQLAQEVREVSMAVTKKRSSKSTSTNVKTT